MKRLLFAAAFLLTATLTFAQAPVTQAQPGPAVQRHGHNPHKAAMRMSKELGLSNDQVSKLEPVLAERKQKVEAVRANTALTDVQRKQQIKEIHQNARMQMGDILTPEQMKQLHTLQRDRQGSKSPAGV